VLSRFFLRAAIIPILALVSTACMDSVSGPRELELVVTLSDSVTVVGRSIEVKIDGAGNQLVGSVISLGDGRLENITPEGPATWFTRRLDHTYAAPGVFQIQATIQEISGRSISASKSVRVTAAP